MLHPAGFDEHGVLTVAGMGRRKLDVEGSARLLGASAEGAWRIRQP